jgi:hypothetical protein
MPLLHPVAKRPGDWRSLTGSRTTTLVVNVTRGVPEAVASPPVRWAYSHKSACVMWATRAPGLTRDRFEGPSKPVDTSYGQATAWNSILRPRALATFTMVA